MKKIPITLRIGGIDKDARRGFKEIVGKAHKSDGEIFAGLTSGKLYRSGHKEFTVWINSRQSDREFIDTFFHEMTHLVCKVLNFRTVNEEGLCRWIGYLAKSQFADAKPGRFGRRIERKKGTP